jgi:hypothetical protein
VQILSLAQRRERLNPSSDTKTTGTGVVVLTYEATEMDAKGQDAKEQN